VKSFAWFVVGVVGGVVVGHFAAKDPRVKALFADLDARTREFTDGIREGYASRVADESRAAEGTP
jgi:hypothetical protein